MFKSNGYFKAVLCPEHPHCKRINCLFSHKITGEFLNQFIKDIALTAKALVKRKERPDDSELTAKASKKPETQENKVTRIIPKGASVAPLNSSFFFANSKVSSQIRERVIKQLEGILKDTEKAKQKEAEIHFNSSASTYKNNAFNEISQLKRQPVKKREQEFDYDFLERFLHSEQVLRENDYPFIDDIEICDRNATQECDRCSKIFAIEQNEECCYHPGKKLNGQDNRYYECCGGDVGSKGCLKSLHVFSESFTQMRKHVKFHELKGTGDLRLLALDCEMGYTTCGLELLRLSVVDKDLKTVMDDFVLPEGEIVDYNEKWSGINETLFNSANKLSLSEIHTKLSSIISDNAVFIGHSFESDLKALRVVWNRVLDTSILYPHTRGAPYKRALKNLVRENLKKFIQESHGHDSTEDAKSAMELLLFYLKEEKKRLSYTEL